MDAMSHPRSHSWLEIPQWECWLLFLPHHKHRHWSEEMTNPGTWAPASGSVGHLPVGYQRARSSSHSESLSHPPAFFGRLCGEENSRLTMTFDSERLVPKHPAWYWNDPCWMTPIDPPVNKNVYAKRHFHFHLGSSWQQDLMSDF